MSLVEMLVTVVVLMALALVSYFAIGSKIAKARDAKRKSDLDRVKVAMYEYHFDMGCFPTEIPECGQAFGFESQPYMPSFPCGMSDDAFVYVAEESDCPSWFRLFTNLEVDTDASIEAVGCSWGCGPDDCGYNYGVASTNTKLNVGCVTYYACAPNGECVSFYDPEKSQCPRVFENDTECGGISCSKDKGVKCHDMSGKFHE